MTKLPDEIWNDILDYLDPYDIVSTQRVSSRLLELARDSRLWRYKCFEKAPSAAYLHASKPNALASLTGALGGLSLADTDSRATRTDGALPTSDEQTRARGRARAVLDWDCSHKSERIDWYSEFMGRDATLSTRWTEDESPSQEVRGMTIFDDAQRVIAPIEDGSICIWDIEMSDTGRHQLRKLGKSKRGILFQDITTSGQPSVNKTRSLGHAVDNITVDSKRMRAYVSAEEYLNEIDLARMEIVSQTKFAWPITALSQERPERDFDLTIGTSWSLHLHDPRVPLGDRHTPVDGTALVDRPEEDSTIAFLPNYTKLRSMRETSEISDPSVSPADSDYIDSVPRGGLKAYARVEPGPQSILHHGDHEIIIAGRMPSILFYDRRFFPRLESVIHSGARLSAMTTLSVPPAKADPHTTGNSTLIACGEYGGCGSLEIYELPHDRRPPTSLQPHGTNAISITSLSDQSVARPYRYRNRQEASSSKLLSVATQGTRIVFSDAEGTLKWVERDGRGLARRWNINAFTMTETGGSITGEQVVRKMTALPQPDSRRGTRGDGDLLVWTGEKIGVITTKPKSWTEVAHNDLVQSFEEKMTLNSPGDTGDEDDGQEINEERYARLMRLALQRQADERRWMSRFGLRRW